MKYCFNTTASIKQRNSIAASIRDSDDPDIYLDFDYDSKYNPEHSQCDIPWPYIIIANNKAETILLLQHVDLLYRLNFITPKTEIVIKYEFNDHASLHDVSAVSQWIANLKNQDITMGFNETEYFVVTVNKRTECILLLKYGHLMTLVEPV